MAQGLAEAGCSVVLHGLEPAANLAALCAMWEDQFQVPVHYVLEDLSHREGVLRLHEAACDRMGPPDILLNNAVVRHFGPIETLAFEDWQKALAVNVSAAFSLIQCVLPAMRAAQFGRLIQMTSVYGQRGTPQRVDYVTSKTALIGLTRAVAAETVGDGITSNAISPGSVLTPGTDSRVMDLMRAHQLDRESAETRFLRGKQPSGRFVQAADVAASVVYLCSPAARDITGQVLSLDGGWSAL
jgi:3-hydroxybutyrate dehydrogenase